MKMLIRGMEPISGISSKNNKPFDMSKIHTEIPLAPSRNAEQPTMGFCGRSYPTTVDVLAAVKHLKDPFVAEVDLREQMIYGKPELTVFSIVPVEAIRKLA